MTESLAAVPACFPACPDGWRSARGAEPAREGRLARALRFIADRRLLLEMDGRLLDDLGLTRGEVRRGVPFRAPARCAAAPEPPPAPPSGPPAAMARLGTLEARNWHLKLYAPAPDAAGLRREDLAAARRAVRAVVAEPRPGSVAGFAVLAPARDATLPSGSLVLAVCHWEEGGTLQRTALLLPIDGGAVRRLRDRGPGLAELLLAAGEGLAWQRHTLRPSPSSLLAYVAEDCA